MKILVFGATGGVGQQFVKLALEEGHEVTAFVRTPTKLTISHPQLTVIQGDALDQVATAKAIENQDAVVSCLGTNGLKKSNLLEQMVKNIVDGMKSNGISRIVYTASAGIDKEIPGLSGKIVMMLLKNALEDHRNAVNYIKSNHLYYTIARPMSLNNDELNSTYRETFEGIPSGSRSISRASVAHFLLKSLQDSKYENSSVGISN